LRSSALGKSTKKISSKRPFLKNSPGNRSTRLAVAMTNTGEFSCIQVRKEPKMRLDVPPSESDEPLLPANDLSNSSMKRIAGKSMLFKALRRFASERPLSCRIPRSSLSLKSPELAFPWVEVNRYSLALSVKAFERCLSQRLSSSKPPTASSFIFSMYSRTIAPDQLLFSDRTMSTSSCKVTLGDKLSASSRVKP